MNKINSKQLEQLLRQSRKVINESNLVGAKKSLFKTIDNLNNNVTFLQQIRIKYSSLFNFSKNKHMGIQQQLIAKAVSAVAAVVIVSGGTVAAANSAVPGTPLFGLDKALENVQRSFATTKPAKAKLEADILSERLQELKTVQASTNTGATTVAIKEVQDQKTTFDTVVTDIETDKVDVADSKTLKEVKDIKDSVESTYTGTVTEAIKEVEKVKVTEKVEPTDKVELRKIESTKDVKEIKKVESTKKNKESKDQRDQKDQNN